MSDFYFHFCQHMQVVCKQQLTIIAVITIVKIMIVISPFPGIVHMVSLSQKCDTI